MLRPTIKAEGFFKTAPAWIWLLAFSTLFTIYGLLSNAVYSDDELTHALHLPVIWEDPAIMLSPFVRPGFKLLYILQSGLGPVALIVTNAIFSAFTCIFSMRIAARLNVPYPELSGIICASIPILYILSFRMYGEVPATTLFAIAVDAILARRWILAAFVVSAMFPIRQEMAMYAMLLGAWLLWQRQWKAILVLAWSPLVLNLVGFLATGDPIWVWRRFFAVFVNDVPTVATGSLFLSLGYIFSSAILLFAIIGICFGQKRLKLQAWPVNVALFLLLIHYAAQYIFSKGWITHPSPGWWRFLLPMAPLMGVFAAMGIAVLWREKWWRDGKILFAIAASLALIAAFLSYKHNYYNIWKDGWREAPLNLALAALGLLLALRLLRIPERWSMAALTPFFIGSVILVNPPFKPTFEEKTMAQIARELESRRDRSQPVYCNHIYYYYYGRIPYNKKNPLHPGLEPGTVKAAPPGAYIIWESHYGFIESKDMGIPEAELEAYGLEEINRYCEKPGCESGFYVRVFRKK